MTPGRWPVDDDVDQVLAVRRQIDDDVAQVRTEHRRVAADAAAALAAVGITPKPRRLHLVGGTTP